MGRVGGLLSPLTGSCREVEAAVGFVAELGVDVDVRFAAVKSRFGGIPFLGGDFCAACTGVSRTRGVSARFIFLSTSERTFLGEGRDSIGGAPCSDAMISLQRHLEVLSQKNGFPSGRQSTFGVCLLPGIKEVSLG